MKNAAYHNHASPESAPEPFHSIAPPQSGVKSGRLRLTAGDPHYSVIAIIGHEHPLAAIQS